MDPSNLNLTCVDDRLIGLIGSMYFLAWGTFSIITPNLADRFGRKWILFTVSVMQVICALLLQLSKSIYFTIVVYFFIGISASGRVTITTTYMSELVWSKHRIAVNTLLHVGDGFVMVVQVGYYFLFRDSYPLYWFTMSAIFILTLLILVIPESPKYYYARNRFDDARKSLSFVAWVNRAQRRHEVMNIRFDKEVYLKQG